MHVEGKYCVLTLFDGLFKKNRAEHSSDIFLLLLAILLHPEVKIEEAKEGLDCGQRRCQSSSLNAGDGNTVVHVVIIWQRKSCP